ncbi:imidazolonepropionase protein [Salinisphaera shabanensis E1L3A]|uniref:Imidazolonepropionase protein n=1 Tax=Salinisphaera shabanensis E1L3A TaxID=1033802 RepID=U2FT38_9GAMM|nr:amidohydrolase [Salinisphaera shabanensis]ERJ17568.1 imidazolonepropionase protein [Salinisphaera shabanensis E1L3A]
MRTVLRSAGAALALAGVCLVGSATAAAPSAETIYLNGRIHTQDSERSIANAVAIAEGRFIAVGEEETVRAHADDSTRIIDLHGKTVVPGIVDGHGHYVRGFKRQLFSCDFPSSAEPDEITERVKQCVADAKPGEWVVGGAWASAYADSGKIDRTRLDAVSPDNPVYLLDDTGHNGYVNSKALKAAGFTKKRAAEMAAIQTDADGEPNGILFEEAAGELTQAIPPMSDAKYQQTVRRSVNEANRFGITTFVEARTDRPTVRAYHDVDQKDGLHARVATFLQYDTDFNETAAEQRKTLADRAQYRSNNVYPDFAKLYLDGVPPALTASLLEPYEAGVLEAKGQPADYKGELRMKPDAITQDAIELARQGVTVKMHATGDGSVRAALDAFEAARKANPEGELHHSIAHASVVAPADLKRFAELDVAADVAPPLWIRGPYSSAMRNAIGHRYDKTPPTKALLDAGAVIAYGSDWPSISSSINPWPHLASMVEREIGPEESISLQAAVDTMTRGAAYTLNLSDEIGSIEAGKSADLVVLDRDIFDIPNAEIADTKALRTVFRGKTVYEAQSP